MVQIESKRIEDEVNPSDLKASMSLENKYKEHEPTTTDSDESIDSTPNKRFALIKKTIKMTFKIWLRKMQIKQQQRTKQTTHITCTDRQGQCNKQTKHDWKQTEQQRGPKYSIHTNA